MRARGFKNLRSSSDEWARLERRGGHNEPFVAVVIGKRDGGLNKCRGKADCGFDQFIYAGLTAYGQRPSSLEWTCEREVGEAKDGGLTGFGSN